ncbi:hypothetical protein B0H11DRAFT_2047098, partial [Mycena galericulata]
MLLNTSIPPQNPNIWIACIYPIANVEKQPIELKAIIEAQQHILDVMRNHLAKSYVTFYGGPSWDQSYGSVKHLQRLEENMVVYANDFYSDLCMNLHQIKEVR